MNECLNDKSSFSALDYLYISKETVVKSTLTHLRKHLSSQVVNFIITAQNHNTVPQWALKSVRCTTPFVLRPSIRGKTPPKTPLTGKKMEETTERAVEEGSLS